MTSLTVIVSFMLRRLCVVVVSFVSWAFVIMRVVVVVMSVGSSV